MPKGPTFPAGKRSTPPPEPQIITFHPTAHLTPEQMTWRVVRLRGSPPPRPQERIELPAPKSDGPSPRPRPAGRLPRMTDPRPLPDRAADFRRRFAALEAEVGKVIVGQPDTVRGVLTALFAGGHVLLEGVPGLGKTLLVR